MFAELLELVVAHGLKIQAPLPAYAVPSQLAGGSTEEVLVSTVKPLLVLQNPGYYYYTAGNCAVQRKVMFERAMTSEVGAWIFWWLSLAYTDARQVKASQASVTALNNEKKVDHTGLIIEVGYLHFLIESRLTRPEALHQSLQLAAGKAGQEQACALHCIPHSRNSQRRTTVRTSHDVSRATAIRPCVAQRLFSRFLRKIAHVYEEERWNPIVWSIRSLWYECAQRTGTADDAARLLLEMMAPCKSPLTFVYGVRAYRWHGFGRWQRTSRRSETISGGSGCLVKGQSTGFSMNVS